MTENELSEIIVDKCVKVHKTLGPGLLESVYHAILFHELTRQGLKCVKEVGIPVAYEGVQIDLGFRADIIVEGKVILELKSIENVLPVHKKQLLTYLKVTGLKLGLLLNFGDALMKDGISRVVNNL